MKTRKYGINPLFDCFHASYLPILMEIRTEVLIPKIAYDATGTLVRTLSLGYQPPGFYQNRESAAYWDGRNALDEPVASGVYFYQLVTPSFQQTRRMLILK